MTRIIIALMLLLVPFVCHAEWRTMEVSAYCDQGYTASGEWVQEGFAASDDLPLGTVVIVNGVSYIVMDRFGGGYADHLDLYMPSYDAAIAFGRQVLDVYVER